jgi:outer membrane receptor for ferric coprogen and ferric-rhodotorulic acid
MTITPNPCRRLAAVRAPISLAVGALIAFSSSAQTRAAGTDAPPSDGPREPAVLDVVTVTGQRADRYTVEDSSSAAKLTLSPRETPQSMTVITRQRLDDQALTSLREVLDNTPGVYSNAYDTERVLFYARGFLIDTLMVDGVPALSNFNTGSIDETLETAFYERIEVVRGATGLMTGAGNPAASINLVRKHADSTRPAISLDLSAGSWRDRRAEVDASAPLSADGRVRGRAVAVAEDRDSYQALYHKRTYALYGIVDADLTPATRVSVGFDYQDGRPRSNTWGSFPLFLADGTSADWPRSVTTATDWTYWNRKTQTVFGELRHTFDNDWTLRSSVSRRQYDENLKLFYVFGYPDPVTGAGLDPSAYGSRGRITENALDLYASGPFELMGRKHELVVGYNGSRAKNVGTEYEPLGTLAPTGNFFQWDGRYPQPAFGPGTPLNDIKTTQDAVYAAARFSLADSLKLIAGARDARWKVDSHYVYDTPADSKYDFSKIIPYTGLVWDFLPQFSAFASYTGIFKPQNSRDIAGHYLDPVEGRSLEVGIKGEHMDRRLNTAFTIFETRQNNVAAPVLDAATGDPILLPDGSEVSQALDGTRTRGFEIELAGRLTDELQASFGWTRYLTKDRSGQTIRTFLPSTMVRLFTTWAPRRLVEGLTLGAGVNWQSATSTEVGSPSGLTTLRQASLAQVSLMARYKFSPNVSLQFNANNVFDKKYYVLDQYDNTYYGSPANYALTLRLSY